MIKLFVALFDNSTFVDTVHFYKQFINVIIGNIEIYRTLGLMYEIWRENCKLNKSLDKNDENEKSNK